MLEQIIIYNCEVGMLCSLYSRILYEEQYCAFAFRPIKAFSILTIFTSRLRPTFMRVRSGFRAWFDAKIAIPRIQVINFSIVTAHFILFFVGKLSCISS